MVDSGAMQNFGMILNKFSAGQENQQDCPNSLITIVLNLLIEFSHFIDPESEGNDWSISCFVETNLITRLVILLEQICS